MCHIKTEPMPIAVLPAIRIQIPDPPDFNLTAWDVSPLGYIRHRDANSDAGRVTWFKGNIAINCSLHSQCRICRIATRYDQDYLVAWLIRGKQLPAGSLIAAKKAEGKLHMQSFVDL